MLLHRDPLLYILQLGSIQPVRHFRCFFVSPAVAEPVPEDLARETSLFRGDGDREPLSTVGDIDGVAAVVAVFSASYSAAVLFAVAAVVVVDAVNGEAGCSLYQVGAEIVAV